MNKTISNDLEENSPFSYSDDVTVRPLRRVRNKYIQMYKDNSADDFSPAIPFNPNAK